VRRIVLTGALTAVAAGVGFLGTRPDSPWYRSIERPPWEPPAAAFPLVWTPLYGLIAWGTGRAAERAGADQGRVLSLTAADLAANAGWCWAFFARESPAAGLATIAVLDGLNIALVREAARHDRVAAAALAPYVVWTGFATALNTSIWWRNRAR
jgi:tryptophan-rich sensory protein